MYIPKINAETNSEEIIAFMKQFSFATIITSKDNLPIASHLPFLITKEEDNLILISHFAKANEQWRHLEENKVLIIFSEPHAYISPENYLNEQEVPTWNYIAIHTYGVGKLISETEKTFKILEATIDNYESSFKQKWNNFPDEYKLKMIKGIVAFEIKVTEIQAKKKLSQNKSDAEKEKIIDTLSKSSNTNEVMIADFMRKELNSPSRI